MKDNRLKDNKLKGFTLIEVLVVLVILSMTSAILVSGLSTIWKSFERLSQKQINQASNIGISWLRQSVENAVMFHPNDSVFFGDARTIKFVTAMPIDDASGKPIRITWMLIGDNETTELWHYNELNNTRYKVYSHQQALSFRYLVSGKWQATFQPTAGVLPQAISLVTEQSTLLLASPNGPLQAIAPAEFILYGAYEF